VDDVSVIYAASRSGTGYPAVVSAAKGAGQISAPAASAQRAGATRKFSQKFRSEKFQKKFQPGSRESLRA